MQCVCVRERACTCVFVVRGDQGELWAGGENPWDFISRRFMLLALLFQQGVFWCWNSIFLKYLKLIFQHPFEMETNLYSSFPMRQNFDRFKSSSTSGLVISTIHLSKKNTLLILSHKQVTPFWHSGLKSVIYVVVRVGVCCVCGSAYVWTVLKRRRRLRVLAYNTVVDGWSCHDDS